MRMVMVFGLVLMAFMVGACASNEKPRPIKGFSPIGQWRLIAMEGKEVELPEGARQPTMTVSEDGSVSGMAGINRYSATVDTAVWIEGQWALGASAMTRMGGPAKAMEFERHYMELLDRADTFFPGSRELELVGDDAFMLRFERVGE